MTDIIEHTDIPVSAQTRTDTRGTNQTGMRARNERLVLTLIRRHGALAKSEIARLTSLSAQTVSVIMRSLEEEGLLLKGDPQRGKVGQPTVPMRLNPDGAFFLGLKIGRRSSEVVLTDFLGTIIARRKRIHPYPDFEQVLAFATGAVHELRQALPDEGRARIAGIGIAIPFQLWDWPRLIGVDPARMAAWQSRDIRQELSDRLDLAVFVQNDATSACAAELVFGPGDQPASFLHFFVGFFIGGGVVLNGTLFPGRSANAGAIGPMPVIDLKGKPCQLMDRASLVVLERMLDQAGLDSALLWDSPEGWDLPPEIMADWLAEAANAIARAAHAAMAVIDFDAIRVDGWLPVALRDALVARVRDRFEVLNFIGLERPEISPGSVGPDARSLGAASQPLLARFLVGYTP